MKAIILVGGEGSRLRPLTTETPKQMLEVAGLTMLERVLDQLYGHGISEVVLALGYRPHVFRSAYPDGYARGVKLHYAVEQVPLDTAGAIGFAADSAKIAETVVVVNGDVLTDIDLGALVGFHQKRKALATISLVAVDDPSAFGVVPTDRKGKVLAFIEKPDRESAPTNLINAGAYVLSPEVLAMIPHGARMSIERELFPSLVAAGALFALPSMEYWIDAGTPHNFLRATIDIISGKRPGVYPAGQGGPKNVDVSVREKQSGGAGLGTSYIAPGALVSNSATVSCSAIEAGAVIRNYAKVVNSVILPGATVAEGCFIEDSIIGRHTVLPRDAVVISGSVIARHAVLEPGCRVEGERVPT